MGGLTKRGVRVCAGAPSGRGVVRCTGASSGRRVIRCTGTGASGVPRPGACIPGGDPSVPDPARLSEGTGAYPRSPCSPSSSIMSASHPAFRRPLPTAGLASVTSVTVVTSFRYTHITYGVEDQACWQGDQTGAPRRHPAAAFSPATFPANGILANAGYFGRSSRQCPAGKLRAVALCWLWSLSPMLGQSPTADATGNGGESLEPPSSSGLGHRPFKAAARVRIPLGAPAGISWQTHGPVEQLGVLATLSRWRSRVQIPSGPLGKSGGTVSPLMVR